MKPSASRRDAVVPSGVWIPAAMPALAAASAYTGQCGFEFVVDGGAYGSAPHRRRIEGPTDRHKCPPVHSRTDALDVLQALRSLDHRQHDGVGCWRQWV